MKRPILVFAGQSIVMASFSMGFESENVKLAFLICCAIAYTLLGHHHTDEGHNA